MIVIVICVNNIANVIRVAALAGLIDDIIVLVLAVYVVSLYLTDINSTLISIHQAIMCEP